MTLVNKPHLQPGDVDIEELFIISSSGTAINLIDYLIEFNLYEYIFNNTMSGDIVLSDSRNLIKFLPIIGEEVLIVKLKTPSIEDVIHKAFRIYSVVNRSIEVDQNTQVYTLKFCSFENITDTLSPIYTSFSGGVKDIVSEIFLDFISTTRYFVPKGNIVEPGVEKTDLAFINDTSNKVKFVSPGWTPLECINWLSSKAVPKTGDACSFLFWESNKRFYFGNLEQMFSKYHSMNKVPGVYRQAAAGVRGVQSNGTDDLNEKMTLIEDLKIIRSVDALKNMNNGYAASKSLSLDFINKYYTSYDYDHIGNFDKYKHISGPGSLGFFNKSYRNSHSHIKFHAKNPFLFSGIQNNANEIYPEKYGNRLSNLLEITNFKMQIVIPGRTDLEAGSLIELEFPDTGPVDSTDLVKSYKDEYYSGTYLVTAIRHKVTLVAGGRHTMIAEVVKDSMSKPSDPSTKYGGLW